MSPIGSIPIAPRFRLEHHQIAQVICQIQFSPVLKITRTEDGVIPFQEAIRDTYPRYSTQQGLSIVITPAGVQQQQTPNPLHRFQDTDGRYSVTLASDFVALDTAKYIDIDDFAGRIEVLSQNIADNYGPAEMTRLGLRFTNEFRLGATAPREQMVEILNPGFLGASGSPELGQSLVTSQHVLELADADTRMLVRHGLNPLGGTTVEAQFPISQPDSRLQEPFYLLDIDVFTQTVAPFSVEGIGALLREFNDQVRSFFAWAVPEAYRRGQLGQVDL